MTNKKTCDVLVIGGGIAGIGSAVAAAREGAHTILVEKNNFPGGTAVIALHRFICGLYLSGTSMPRHPLNQGIAEELCAALKGLAPNKSPVRMGKVYVLPFRTEDLVSVFRSLSEREKQLEMLYQTRVISVCTDQQAITSVTLRDSDREFHIIPRMIVDCSGDAAAVQLSGARYVSAPAHCCQLAGFSFRVKGLQHIEDMTAIRVPYALAKGVSEKKIPSYLKFTTFVRGDAADEGYCKLSIPPAAGADRDSHAKNNSLLVHYYLSQYLPEFANSYIAEMSPQVADREGIRLIGEYILTTDDVLNARKFHDGVVKNAWPVEIWDQEKGPRYQYLPPEEYYEIPLRCLKSKDMSNLYCAGRCISASREALGSARVMGTCLSSGEQAGRAAARSIL